MSKVIRATDSIIAESYDSSQDLNQVRIVPRELNFDFGQLFYPQERKRIFDIRCFRRDVDDRQTSVIISPHATLGTLTTLDERVCYALIEMWKEQGKPEIGFFSEREILRRIGIEWGEYTRDSVRDSLKRLRLVGIEWVEAFFDSVTKKFIGTDDNPFTILNHLRIKSTNNEGIGSQIAEFGFDRKIVRNLNSNYFRPVRFDVILSFRSPLAQAMYTFIEPKLYGTNEYHCKTKNLVENLGLLGKTYKYKSERIKKLGRLDKELLGKPTGFGEVIERYEIREGKDDAVLEIGRSGESRIKGKKVEVVSRREVEVQTEVIESLQSVEQDERKPEQKASRKREEKKHKAKKHQPKEETTSTSEKSSQSDSELQELSEIFESATSFTDSSEALNAEALELLKYFDSVFNLDSDLNQNDVPKSELFIERYSLSAGKFLVDFAHRQGCEPGRFSDILSYRAEALEALKHQRQRQKSSQKSKAKVLSLNAKPEQPDLKAIHHFHQKFGGRIQASEKVRAKVQSLIKAHSLDFAIFLVDFVQKKISESHSSYEPNSFSGILSSQNEALEEWERGKRRKQQREREERKVLERRLEDARYNHEKTFLGDYHDYVNELICSLGDEYPERFNEYRVWEAEQRQQKEDFNRSLREKNIKEISLQVFNSERQVIFRLTQFFKNDRNIHIPDFWEWDSTHNPNCFGKSK